MSRVLVMGGLAPTLFLFRAPLLRAMVERGHEVIATAPDEDDRVADAMKDLGVQWRPLDFERNRVQPVRDLLFMQKIRRHLRDIQPDRLITYTIKPNIYGGWAARSEHVPSAAMVTGLGQVFTTPGIRRTLATRMFRSACRHHDHVFVQNPDDRSDLLESGIVDDESKIVMTAGSGVDLSAFPSMPMPDRPIFLMLARLLESKGVRVLIDAAVRLKGHCPEASIRIGGMEDPGSGGIPMDEIHQAHDKGIIEYLGYVADVKQALADCSVYVLPSWYGEGVPHSILEAMATGRPIITTDHRGCRETVAQGRNGLLVPVRDSQALSQAMSAMAEDSGKRADMGKASRALAESRFDAREVATCMLDSLSL